MVAAALHARRRSWQVRGSVIAAEALVALGRVIGYARRCSPALPGVAGALAVSFGIGGIAGHVFGHGLTPWVTLLAAGVFALRLDGQITLRTPRAGNGRGG